MFVQKHTRQFFLLFTIAALFLAGCNVGATPAPTLDVNAINTAIVGTTVAQFSIQFTQTALAAPTSTSTPVPANTLASLPTFAEASPTTAGVLPTISFNTTPVTVLNTPVAGFTQLASPAAPAGTKAALGDACNNSAFEGDVTILDGTIVKPGADFQKIWAIRNTGSCTWDEGYTLVYIAGSTPDLDPYNYNFGKNDNSSDFVAGGAGVNIGLNLTAPCTPGKYEGHWRMRNDKGYYFGTILSVYIEVKEKCKK